jgi:hypothetical protein
MYLAKFKSGNAELNQVIIRIPPPLRTVPAFEPLLQGLLKFAAGFSIRTGLNRGKLDKVVFLNFDKNDVPHYEEELKRLSDTAPSEVQLSQTKDWYDKRSRTIFRWSTRVGCSQVHTTRETTALRATLG